MLKRIYTNELEGALGSIGRSIFEKIVGGCSEFVMVSARLILDSNEKLEIGQLNDGVVREMDLFGSQFIEVEFCYTLLISKGSTKFYFELCCENDILWKPYSVKVFGLVEGRFYEVLLDCSCITPVLKNKVLELSCDRRISEAFAF